MHCELIAGYKWTTSQVVRDPSEGQGVRQVAAEAGEHRGLRRSRHPWRVSC